MFYVICPVCEARIEAPAAACGPDRIDLFNIIQCDRRDTGFDYDDEDVLQDGAA